ncbi:isoleucine--tRNA ligase [Candidatus Babeliales bacterium]|nr:isoleucine--tRNA ligase [Candidatus Babeliales bacterium]
MSNKEKKKNPYQDTLNLQKTDFSIRANASKKEPEILQRWEKENLFLKSFSKNRDDGQKFVLHDGPPYANGHIHLGTVLNKVLKDIVTKSKRMLGFWVPIKPGWDCHGLPIELKVEEEVGKEKIDKVAFKKSCREYASKWIDIQRKEFKNLGVVMDWDHPYITMNSEYESDILKAFAKFVEGGYIDRKGKTVPWCASCQTVLAAAEIEYKERKDPSIYVLFPFDDQDSKKLFSEVLKKNQNLKINLLVWTTTPWTLPLNRAVLLHDKSKYILLKGEGNIAFVVGKDLADQICSILKIEKNILCEFDSSFFNGIKVDHPFVENLKIPILLDNSVLLNEGTACVHCAPGCGPQDYVLAVKKGLEIFSPLSADGKYTKGIKPKELEEMKISDGQIWVLRKLNEVSKLLHKTSIRHSYPHCWRCRNGLMFRATDQWFCNLQKNGLVEKTLNEIENINFVPDWGKARLNAFVSNRTEWCISRQRVWGVPITALLCKKCGWAFLNSDFIINVAQKVAKEGIEFWDKLTFEKMVEFKFISKNFKCKECSAELNEFEKETDILDVWFDSGVSHYAVLAKDEANLSLPADIYLEGSDQHRGWFQSSLLSSMILNKKTCAKTILTHGFCVDEKGYKMSKSLGNVIAPDDIIKNYSRDILRCWVASSDYKDDVSISENILKNVSEVYRKIRNTCRFMISNLYDFDIKKDAVNFENLLYIDQYAFANLYELNNKILQNYSDYDFPAIFHSLNSYCANDLSSVYLDICKDRLYIEKADSLLRRSAQTVIYHILDTVTRLMAPMLSFLSEEVSDFYQKDKNESIHFQSFSDVANIWEILGKKRQSSLELALETRGVKSSYAATYQMYMHGVWNLLEQVRQVVLKSIESKREKGIVKHSLESKVKLYINKESSQKNLLNKFIDELREKEDINRFFKDWFIVSQFEFITDESKAEKTEFDWIKVNVERADGDKCPRCWQWEITDNSEKLCKRCMLVLEK